MRSITLAVVSTVAMSLLAASHAEAGEGHVELYAGAISLRAPEGPHGGRDEGTFGLRGGYRFNDRIGVEGTLGYVDLGDYGWWDTHLTVFDASVLWYANPGRRAELFLFGGAGRSWVHLDYLGVPIPLYDDSLTLHGGAGVAIAVAERLYLRPDLRVRWVDEVDDADWELTLALGWRIGGRAVR